MLGLSCETIDKRLKESCLQYNKLHICVITKTALEPSSQYSNYISIKVLAIRF